MFQLKFRKGYINFNVLISIAISVIVLSGIIYGLKEIGIQSNYVKENPQDQLYTIIYDIDQMNLIAKNKRVEDDGKTLSLRISDSCNVKYLLEDNLFKKEINCDLDIPKNQIIVGKIKNLNFEKEFQTIYLTVEIEGESFEHKYQF